MSLNQDITFEQSTFSKIYGSMKYGADSVTIEGWTVEVNTGAARAVTITDRQICRQIGGCGLARALARN